MRRRQERIPPYPALLDGDEALFPNRTFAGDGALPENNVTRRTALQRPWKTSDARFDPAAHFDTVQPGEIGVETCPARPFLCDICVRFADFELGS